MNYKTELGVFEAGGR